MTKNPYQVIKHRYITEKSKVLQQLQNASSNRYVSKCKTPKFVFVVDKNANKQEIATAIEEIYKDRKIKVRDVNVINVKGKVRQVRGKLGRKPGMKKAIVTLEPGDTLEEGV
jgi:large subunit ribosomal protein L23